MHVHVGRTQSVAPSLEIAPPPTLNCSQEYITTTSSTSRPPVLALLLLQPPPNRIFVREPFTVILRLETEAGLPVQGQPVEAMALAPARTHVRLKASGAIGFTNTQGIANLTMAVDAGLDGSYTLVFVANAVIQAVSSLPTAVVDSVKQASTIGQALVQGAPVEALANDASLLRSIGQGFVDSSANSAANVVAGPARACVLAAVGAQDGSCLRSAALATGGSTTSGVASDALQSAALGSILPLLLFRDVYACIAFETSHSHHDRLCPNASRLVGPFNHTLWFKRFLAVSGRR